MAPDQSLRASSTMVSRGNGPRLSTVSASVQATAAASGRPVISSDRRGPALAFAIRRRQRTLSGSSSCRSSMTTRAGASFFSVSNVSMRSRATCVRVKDPAFECSSPRPSSMTVAANGFIPPAPASDKARRMSSSDEAVLSDRLCRMSVRIAEKGVVRLWLSPRKVSTRIPFRCASSMAVEASLVLPMPGSPISATAPRRSISVSLRMRLSSSRPTNGNR